MTDALQWLAFIAINAMAIYVASRTAENPNNFRKMLRLSGVVKRLK